MEGLTRMFTLVTLILMAVLAVICLGIAVVSRDEVRTGFIALGFVFVLIGGLTFLLNSAKIVGGKEVGVQVTFGAVQAETLKPGFHWVKPWTDVEKISTVPQTDTVKAKVRSSENGTIYPVMIVRWRVDADNASDLYTQIRYSKADGDNADKIFAQIIDPNVRGAAGAALGKLENLDIVNGAKWVTNGAEVKTIAVEYVDKFGLRLDSLQMTGADPDDITEKNIQRASAQQVETGIAKKAQETAREQAERNRIEAAGNAAAAAAVGNLTPNQVAILCLQGGERIMNKNNEDRLVTYTLPCQGSASTAVLAGAK